jgi:hypothetical protein
MAITSSISENGEFCETRSVRPSGYATCADAGSNQTDLFASRRLVVRAAVDQFWNLVKTQLPNRGVLPFKICATLDLSG